MGVKVEHGTKGVNWRAILVVLGAGIGTTCGWMMAKADQDYYHLAWGALIGGIVGYWINELIVD